MASLESLEQTLGRFRRQEFKLVEHTPPSEKVSPVDVVRVDHLGRSYVACPAGQPPHSRLALTDEERSALVEPPPPKPQGHMHGTGYGFCPEGMTVGEYEDNGD